MHKTHTHIHTYIYTEWIGVHRPFIQRKETHTQKKIDFGFLPFENFNIPVWCWQFPFSEINSVKVIPGFHMWNSVKLRKEKKHEIFKFSSFRDENRWTKLQTLSWWNSNFRLMQRTFIWIPFQLKRLHPFDCIVCFAILNIPTRMTWQHL